LTVMKKEYDRPVYYFYGEEEVLMGDALASIEAASLTPGLESMNRQVFYPDGLDAGEVVAAARTMPAFSGKRLVIVRGAQSLREKDRKTFVEYIKSPTPSTVLVFVAPVAKLEKKGEFFKALDAAGAIVAFRRLRTPALLDWIRKEASKRGKTITPGAAARLAELAGPGLNELRAEIEKITLYVGQKERVDEDDVVTAGLDCRSETIFGLADAVGMRDLKKALKVYSKISREPPLAVLGALARHMRILLRIKALVRKGISGKRLASETGVKEYFLRDYLRGSRLYSEDELLAALERLYRADRDLKSGRLPKEAALTPLIMDLTGLGRRRGRA